ncbi:MAG: hypothetical protein WA649_06345, partial [Methylovirgula sp.]
MTAHFITAMRCSFGVSVMEYSFDDRVGVVRDLIANGDHATDRRLTPWDANGRRDKRPSKAELKEGYAAYLASRTAPIPLPTNELGSRAK